MWITQLVSEVASGPEVGPTAYDHDFESIEYDVEDPGENPGLASLKLHDIGRDIVEAAERIRDGVYNDADTRVSPGVVTWLKSLEPKELAIVIRSDPRVVARHARGLACVCDNIGKTLRCPNADTDGRLVEKRRRERMEEEEPAFVTRLDLVMSR